MSNEAGLIGLEEVGFAEKVGDHLNIHIDDDLGWVEGEKLYRVRPSSPLPAGVMALTADEICSSPLIELLIPTVGELISCEVRQDEYNLMKELVRTMFKVAAYRAEYSANLFKDPASTPAEPGENPRLEYIPNTVSAVGDEFERDGTTYRLVGNPSSDGEVAMCLDLSPPPHQPRADE